MSIVYYVSGHGYGHGRRSAEVIRALLELRPETHVSVRTTAPERLFAGLPGDRVSYIRTVLDPGAVEADALTIDWERTGMRVEDALDRMAADASVQGSAMRREGLPKLILADVPFFAGPIAAVAGVPCVAVTNFTWDWIYEPYFKQHGRLACAWERVAEAYGHMRTLLRMPFSGCADRIGEVIDIPLVTRRSRRTPDEILRQLSLRGPAKGRGRVLVAMRGGVSELALVAAARSAPEFEFLCIQPIGSEGPGNLKEVQVGAELDFSDLLAVSDAAVSKLGYGTVAECIASDTALLWPPRAGFREDEVVSREGPRYLRMRPISREDFEAGNWGAGLRELVGWPAPPEAMRTDGAEVCAEWIARQM
jgi:L-arabinokinase